jgi:hypothetical protein
MVTPTKRMTTHHSKVLRCLSGRSLTVAVLCSIMLLAVKGSSESSESDGVPQNLAAVRESSEDLASRLAGLEDPPLDEHIPGPAVRHVNLIQRPEESPADVATPIAPRPEESNADVHCLACDEHKPAAAFAPVGCPHSLCLSCMKRHIHSCCMNDSYQFKCCLPDCVYTMTHEEITRYGNDDDVQKYENHTLTAEEKSSGPSDVEREQLEQLMNKCKCTGTQCGCYTDIFKPCPGCGWLIERTEDCNHMTCETKGCGCQFCWTCGGPFVGNLPAYSGRFESTGCESFACNYYGPARDGYCVERVEVRHDDWVDDDWVDDDWVDEQAAGPAPASVEVEGAGEAQVNGLYHRREHAHGPPRAWSHSEADWNMDSDGRPWYEKDDGCFIHHIDWRAAWYILGPDGRSRYFCNVPAEQDGDAPPSQGWRVNARRYAPVPTLQVVD